MTLPNPYSPTDVGPSTEESRRSVWRHAAASFAVAVAAIQIGSVGLVLLNQEWNWIPTNTSFYEFEFGGRIVATNVVMRWSLGIATALLLASFVFAYIAVRHWRHNRKQAQTSTNS